MRSIQQYLLAWIMGALMLGSVLIALVTYVVTLDEMNEVFDADLKNVAQSVGHYHRSAYGSARQDDVVLPVRNDPPKDVEIVTVTWTSDGLRVYSSDPRAKVPFSNQEGLSRPVIAGEGWIVYSSVGPGGVTQAAQRVAQRHQMAAESGAKVFPPMFILIVVVGGLLVYGLRRGMRPLDKAARDVAAKSAQSLAPIADSAVPREIKPLVRSINDLLGRLASSFSAQRRFLADAAHELRTPITALRLQLALLRQSTDSPTREGALQELEKGIARSQRLIQQLMAVARSGPDGEAPRLTSVDLDELVRSTVVAFSLQADQAGIDLGARADQGAVVRADADQLQVLLNNLVENALRYTPRGGLVDVEADTHDGQTRLRVIDSGPGIPESERQRVFDRFYRGPNAQAERGEGSGLGLGIVRAIAERHAAQVGLYTAPSGRGLEVCVVFPPNETRGLSAP